MSAATEIERIARRAHGDVDEVWGRFRGAMWGGERLQDEAVRARTQVEMIRIKAQIAMDAVAGGAMLRELER
ncbi:MAG TPA: hypothetical protein VM366_00070 [Anaerolineae bacterium]|nr:hypothetical protein [Anaerolineae bacterium]